MATHTDPRLRIPVVRGVEEVWGDEDREVSSSSSSDNPPQHKYTASHSARQRLRLSSHTDFLAEPAERDRGVQRGPATLQASSLGALLDYLPDVLAAGPELLQALPPDAKAVLLALARRQGLLGDTVLNSLADEMWNTLDLSGCSGISDTGLEQTLPRLAHLQAIDLSGCRFNSGALRELGHWCPNLQLLRLGGSPTANHAAAHAVKHIVPLLQPADVEESWEDTLEKPAPPTGGSGRLMRLQCLVWPAMPAKLQAYLAQQCPKLLVNLANVLPHDKVPTAADPAQPLDSLILQAFTIDRLLPAEATAAAELAPSVAVMSMAERFKNACLQTTRERAQRTAVKVERNYQQQRRRELRNSKAEQAIKKYLDSE